MVKIDKKWCYFHLKWCYLHLRWCYLHLRWWYLRRWLGCSIDFAFSAYNFAENPKKIAEIYLRYLPLFACMPRSGVDLVICRHLEKGIVLGGLMDKVMMAITWSTGRW